MARIITSRYPATCADCGASLPKGSRIRYYGRGRLYGVECHERDGATSSGCSTCDGHGELAGGRACQSCDGTGSADVQDYARSRTAQRLDTDGTPLAMTRNGWRRGYEATGFRCEDAPCCGCCD